MQRFGGLCAWRWLTAVTLVTSTLVMGGPAHAVSTASVHVSVGLAPATARVSSVAVVSGTVSSHKAGDPLVLQRMIGKHWFTLARAKTSAGGRYLITLRAPKKAATMVLRVTRTVAPPSSSPAVHLRVVKTSFAVRASAPANVASGAPVVVSGSVRPKATGSVWLQALQRSVWHNVVSAKLTATSTFQLTRTLPTGSYKLRVVKGFSTTAAAGNSSALSVTVAPPVTTGPPPPPAPAALAVATTTLPAATMGVPYTTALAASGGTAPYAWGTQSSLPSGITLSAAGVLAGFPRATASALVTVTVVDAAGASVSRTLVLTVGASPAAGRTIVAWGANGFGGLGDGTNTDSGVPVQVQRLSGMVAVAGSNGTGYGLRDDGEVWAWGRDDYGQLGDGMTTETHVPIQVSGLSGITAIASTIFGGIALRYDGTVWTWGAGSEGQLGNGTQLTTSTAVQVTGLTNAVAIAGGESSGYALLSDGTVRGWGEGTDGELGNGQEALSTMPVQVSLPSGITAIAGAGHSAYALRSDGTVWAWGDNSKNQLGVVTDSPLHSTPLKITALTGVKAIAGGSNDGYALLADGTVWAWGANDGGQLGDGATSVPSHTPVQVEGLTEVLAISAGTNSAFAVHPGGTVSSWGYDSEGELGDGHTTNSAFPVPVSGLSGAISLSAGSLAYAEYAVV